MKRNLSFLLSIALFVMLYTNPAFSQFRLKIGPSIGANFNIHTGSDLPQSGNGFGIVIGGQADMSFTPTVGLIANMQLYDNRSGSFTQTSSNQYQDQAGNPVTSSVSTDNSASIAYFALEALFKLSLKNNNLFFFAGPSLGFNIEGSYNQTQTETFPSPYQSNNTSNSSSGSFQNMNTRFELKFGGGYDIPEGSMFITPQLSFGYGLTEVQQNFNWRILTIQALVTVKFDMI
jgi:hypothetical protein